MAPEILESLPWTYTAGMFRTARFGVAEAHGLGMVLQTNFLLEKGAVEITEDGRFAPVPELFEASFGELVHELLMIQALGDYAPPCHRSGSCTAPAPVRCRWRSRHPTSRR
jgi:hypothetical protein